MASVFMGHTLGESLTLIFSEESINMALDTAYILSPEFRIEGYFLHISKGEFAFFKGYFLTVKEKKIGTSLVCLPMQGCVNVIPGWGAKILHASGP